MYYHNSPTTRQLKTIKAAKATEMRAQLAIMRGITAKYERAIGQLERLREYERTIDTITDRLTPGQLAQAHDTIARGRSKAKKLVAKIITDTSVV